MLGDFSAKSIRFTLKMKTWCLAIWSASSRLRAVEYTEAESPPRLEKDESWDRKAWNSWRPPSGFCEPVKWCRWLSQFSNQATSRRPKMSHQCQWAYGCHHRRGWFVIFWIALLYSNDFMNLRQVVWIVPHTSNAESIVKPGMLLQVLLNRGVLNVSGKCFVTGVDLWASKRLRVVSILIEGVMKYQHPRFRGFHCIDCRLPAPPGGYQRTRSTRITAGIMQGRFCGAYSAMQIVGRFGDAVK